MAKKKRKGRKPNLPQEVLARVQNQPGRQAVAPSQPSASAQDIVAAKPEAVGVNFAEEYQYVMIDLQRIGILSILVMVALVLLKILVG